MLFIKKSILLFIAAVIAVLFVYPQQTQAQFKHDFLYKFQSRWSDVAVNRTGTRIFIINESYSRIEEYNAAGVLQAIHGNFGTGTTEFNRPQALVIDSTDVTNDYLYILDTGNNRVIRYTTPLGVSGTVLGATTTWGSYGSAVGEFNNPTGITTDGTNIYIADTDNNRVQKCTKDGVTCTAWGTFGTGNSQFSSPKGITYDTSLTHIYVADTGNNRIQIFDTAGAFQSTFGTYGSGSGYFVLPYRVITEGSASHYIYVLDTFNRIQRFLQSDKSLSGTITLGSPGGGIGVNASTLYVASLPTTLKTYGTLGSMTLVETMSNDIGHPVDMAIDTSGNIFINNNFTTPNEPVIQKFNSSFIQTGEWKGNGSFGIVTNGPMGIGINTGNDLLVADTENNKIQKFTYDINSSNLVWSYNLTPAPTPGAFNSPKDVTTEATGKFYVADTGNGRVVKFEPDGTFMWSQLLPTVAAGTPTPPPGSTPAPYGITVASDNTIYVADAGYHRILRYSANDEYEASWGEYGSADSSTIPQLDTPQGMAIDPAGNIYVADTGNNRIQRFDQNGTLATRVVWGTYGSQDGNFNQPRNVVVDSGNRVFVSEVGNRRIQAFGDATTSAGLTITQTNGTTISEGTTESTSVIDSYTVRLNTQPSTTVLVTLAASNPSQASVTTPSLIFTQYNWNIPQTVTVVPTHDFIANGTHSVVISHTSTSSDTNYQKATSWSDVTVTITDVDVAGVTVSPLSLSLNETGVGSTATYTVKLNSKPTGEVNISPTDASSSAHVILSPTTLSFLNTTWNTLQTVTVTAIDDGLVNPSDFSPPIAKILHNSISPLDLSYNGINIASIAATIVNTDPSGLIISKPGGGSVQVTEGAATDNYVFKLTNLPTDTITVTLTSDVQATTSASLYYFTPSDWDIPQYATVSAIDDYIEEGTHYGLITHTLSSLDGNFDGKIATQTATITDNDTAGITIRLPNGAINIAENGPTDTYYVKLNSEPTFPVLLDFGAQNQATASPGVLSFDSSNWSDEQEITITAIRDYVIEGAHTATVTYTGKSSDIKYNGKTASFVANISDDDSVSAGISIIETDGGTSVTKDNTTDTYTLALTSKPSANVKIKITANGPEATTSASIYWFTPSTWNVKQTVTVTALTSPSGSKTVKLSHLVTSLDLHYNGIAAGTVTVTVNENRLSAPSAANAKAPTCNKTPPYNAPSLFQVTTTQTQATLYFTPIHDNISYYFIAYGFTPGDLRFGTSFEMGSSDGVINYTINMLTPGTTYYFMIRGGNGCATGPWSASLPATAVGPESSAQTTRTFYTTVSTSNSTGGTGSASPTGGIWLTRDLYPGSQGADVRSLQQYLNSNGFTLATSGAGSPGNETTYYGNFTASAVRRFQEAHFAEILSPLGYASGTGICGPSTRNYINSHP